MGPLGTFSARLNRITTKQTATPERPEEEEVEGEEEAPVVVNHSFSVPVAAFREPSQHILSAGKEPCPPFWATWFSYVVSFFLSRRDK